MKQKGKIYLKDLFIIGIALVVLLTYSFPYSGMFKILCTSGAAIYMLLRTLSFKPCVRNLYTVCYLGFIAWGFLSNFWASSKTGVREQEFNMLVAVASNIIITLFIYKYRQDFRTIYRWLFPVIVIFLLEALLVGEFNSSGRFSNNGSVNQFGITTSYIYLITLYAIKKFKNARKFEYPVLLLSVILTYLSGSRKALANLILFTIMIFLFEKYDKNLLKNLSKLIAVVAIAGVFFAAAIYIKPLYNVIGYRIISLVKYFNGNLTEDLSALRRAYMRQDAIKLFRQHPVIGIGLNNFKYSARYGTYAHSDIFEILCCLGIVGEILYFIPVITAFVISFFQWKRNYPYAVIPFSIFLGLLINETSNISYIYGMIHVFLGVAAGMLFVNIRSGELARTARVKSKVYPALNGRFPAMSRAGEVR